MTPFSIALDAHWLIFTPKTGGTTYLNPLISEWIKCEEVAEIQLLLPCAPKTDWAGQPFLASKKVRLFFPKTEVHPLASYRAQFFWQQRGVPALLRQSRPDVYLSPFHLTPQLPPGLPMVTTIHDLCFFMEPRWSQGSIIHGAQLWSACLRARRLVCVSDFTFQALSRWSPRFARKATVVHSGIETRTLPVNEAEERVNSLKADLRPQTYLVWVGLPSARKNPELLFNIFGAHHERFPGHKFAVVAPAKSHDELRALARANGILTQLRLFSEIDAPTRDALYCCALALVFPSKCEGFGYPVLEAMGQGCPPLTFEKGPASEMVNGIIPLAREATPKAFSEMLNRYAAMTETERARIGADLIARAKIFSPTTMAAGTLAVLRSAAFEK